MSDDIVKRARRLLADAYVAQGCDEPFDFGEVMRVVPALADEVERLRGLAQRRLHDWNAEAEDKSRLISKLLDERDAANAEVERLRDCGDGPKCGMCLACISRVNKHLHEQNRTLLTERDAARARLREVAQTLIKRVGANGPMSALDAALRALAVLDAAIAQRDAARAVLEEVLRALSAAQIRRHCEPGIFDRIDAVRAYRKGEAGGAT